MLDMVFDARHRKPIKSVDIRPTSAQQPIKAGQSTYDSLVQKCRALMCTPDCTSDVAGFEMIMLGRLPRLYLPVRLRISAAPLFQPLERIPASPSVRLDSSIQASHGSKHYHHRTTASSILHLAIQVEVPCNSSPAAGLTQICQSARLDNHVQKTLADHRRG
jgi:hypothetical protein